MPALRRNTAVLVAFAALTVLLTYPQARVFGTSVPHHSDPYFSMWRLNWVAHAILGDLRQLFEANIFFPAHDTLGYSDAMLLPGVVLAPLFWMGAEPVAIYNVALLASFALSGFTAFLLARRLTGNTAASMVAGVIYAFAPYRFTHYMHLELQVVFWAPLALLLIHRLLTEPHVRDGVLLGMVALAQIFSSVYQGVFLATYCALFLPLLILLERPPRLGRLVAPLAVAAALTLVAAAPYALAYSRAGQSVGVRSASEVERYSASLLNFAQAPSMNRLYGSTAETDPLWADEMNLFPGLTAAALALAGVFLARGRQRFAYLGGLLFAFDLARGFNGLVYPLLFEHLAPFRALRSPARMDLFVNLSLAVLGAYGAARLLEEARRPAVRRGTAAAFVALLSVEYAASPSLEPAPPPSPVDEWLARQPPVVIVELPLPWAVDGGQSRDWLYMYQGLSHRQRMLNGYSGFVPASYYATLDAMQAFPDDRSMAFLRDRRVDYVILRAWLLPPEKRPILLDKIRAREDLSLVANFSALTRPEAIYAVRP